MKFVILGSDSELFRFSYSDLAFHRNSIYVPGISSTLSNLGKILFRFQFSPKTSSFFPVRTKKIWKKKISSLIPEGDEDTCYLVFPLWLEYEPEIHLIDYLKSLYPNSKFVLFFQDIVSSKKYAVSQKTFDIAEIRKQFDFVLSFDYGDCERYDFIYHPLVFSQFKGDKVECPQSDVYFLGKSKNRLPEILDTYKVLRDAGLICDFHLTGVAKENQQYVGEIDYSPSISYIENLQHVLHTKCLLEIMQHDGLGYTQRGCEAVGLGKMLLTNNPYIKHAPFYSSDKVCYFTEPSEIPKQFIEAIVHSSGVRYDYAQEQSPINLICFIESLFS